MASAPQISVLVPVYNGVRHLPECLDSILEQRDVTAEILIADDGSSDGSWDLIQRYAAGDNRIRCWRNPANLGLAGNFNACLRAANGEYVKYLLQDDRFLSPYALARMSAVLDRQPAVVLAASSSFVLDADSRPIEHRRNFPPGRLAGRTAIARCLSRASNLIGEPSIVLFRRRLAARGFDEGYRQLLDLEMWLHLLEQGDFYFLPEPLCAFRKHAAQATAARRAEAATARDPLRLLERWLARPEVAWRPLQAWLPGQLYALRRHPEFRGTAGQADLMKRLGPSRYWFFWVCRKADAPFRRLRRWFGMRPRRLRRQFHRATAYAPSSGQPAESHSK